jgi:hypothetical protein
MVAGLDERRGAAQAVVRLGGWISAGAQHRLADMLTLAGAGQTTAHRLALLIVSAYDGALLQVRVAGA